MQIGESEFSETAWTENSAKSLRKVISFSDLYLTSKGFLNPVKTVIFDRQILVSIELENAVIANLELESRTRLNSTDLKLQAEKN